MFKYIFPNKKFNIYHAILFGVLLIVVIYLLIPTKRFAKIDDSDIRWGVTFSAQYAASLGLDWKDVYTKMFDDLPIKSVRIPVYWDVVEPQEGIYNFDDLDWQIQEAVKHEADVVLAIGYKLPRWPECRKPDWVPFDSQKLQELNEQYIREVVKRYKDHEGLFAWQVENEPLFDFGECMPRVDNFLSNEINIVRELDPNHEIIVTDSGELGTWRKTSKSGADSFGFTTYRIVWNPVFGYFKWTFLTPGLYRKKSNILTKNIKNMYAMELQVEPWHHNFIAHVPLEEQKQIFTLQDIRNNLAFGQHLQLPRVYMWGVEWWYYLQEKQSYGDALSVVQSFFAE